MLKQVTITLDTSDPLQAQLLVEYFASPDRGRFGRSCLLLGYLAATGQARMAIAGGSAAAPQGAVESQQPKRPRVGKGLFGME
jgi:hypothetical protein